MALPYHSLDDLLDLGLIAPDTYEIPGSPQYPWGRVYGGQVVAQGLWAAAQTVEPEYLPHSVHAYFIRGGDCDLPISYEVDRIRDGRSFVTRRVVARQSNKAMLNLSASFQKLEPQADVSLISRPEGIPEPEELEPVPPEREWCPYLDRRWVPEGAYPAGDAVWMRVSHDVGDDPLRNACAMAFMSDDVPTSAAARHHPQRRPFDGDDMAFPNTFVSASLDHAVWFQRFGRADEWQLHIMAGQGITGARGLAIGQVYGRDGTQLASIAQEILIRSKNP